MIRATNVLRKTAINWERCVSRFFPESARPYKEIEAKLDALWREVYAAPEKIAPVDWAKWESLIQDKAAVAAIKKEYEAKSFAPKEPEVYQTAAQAEAAAQKAVTEAEFYKKLINDLKVEISACDKEMNDIFFRSPAENIDLVPGLREEFERQLEELEPYTSNETVKALQSLNPAGISASLAEGKLPPFPSAAYEALDAESPVRKFVEQDVLNFKAEAAKFGVNVKTLPELNELAKNEKVAQ